MKAQTLSICLPGTACDKKCPYCVSKMTWAPKEDSRSWLLNLPKVVHFANMAQVTDVIITGKGEPTINDHLYDAATAFRDWPVVLQTNGKHWAANPEKMNTCMVGPSALINIVQVSIDDPKQMHDYTPLWWGIEKCPPMTARITVMLTPEACTVSFDGWIEMCKTYGIRGLSFREVTVPSDYQNTPKAKQVADWIRGVSGHPAIKEWRKNFEFMFDECKKDPDLPNVVWKDTKQVIRRLPYGAVIRDFDGVSVTKFEYCIQDSNGEDDIRSLVYNQDGHLYTTWSSPASLVF